MLSRISVSVLQRSGGIFDYEVKKERLEEVLGELEDPAVWNEPDRAQALGRERSSLEDVVLGLDTILTDTAHINNLTL